MKLRIGLTRTHFWISATLLITSVLAVGAINITDELSNRPLRQQETERKLREWSRQMVGNMEHGQAEQWRQIAESNPHALINACLIKARKPSPTSHE